MTSNLSIDLDLPALQALLEKAGEKLIRYSSKQNNSANLTKNKFGEVVNLKDFEVQRLVYQCLKDMYPNHIFVGEENISDGCSTIFVEPIDPEQYIWTIDPIDGSANFRDNSKDYAIVIGLQQGRKALFGMAYMPASKQIIMGGTNWQTTINHKPLKPLRPYDPEGVSIAIGLGKRKPLEEQLDFLSVVAAATNHFIRPGCASVSITKVLVGELDAYASLKEMSTNINAWIAILSGTKLEVNIDLKTLDQNKEFCFVVATPDFLKYKMGPGSRLVECLVNINL